MGELLRWEDDQSHKVDDRLLKVTDRLQPLDDKLHRPRDREQHLHPSPYHHRYTPLLTFPRDHILPSQRLQRWYEATATHLTAPTPGTPQIHHRNAQNQSCVLYFHVITLKYRLSTNPTTQLIHHLSTFPKQSSTDGRTPPASATIETA
jgi:hypothetical protein